MACSRNRTLLFCWEFAFLIISVNTCHGFYFPDMNTPRNTFSVGEEIYAEVNSLMSVKSEIPLSYYSLPFCEPQGGVKKSPMNVGQLLMGDEIQNSPYRFRMNINETVFLCIKGPLTAEEAELLKQRTRDLYRVNMILDHLPVTQSLVLFRLIGSSFGLTLYRDTNVYISNHLMFRVLIHEHKASGLPSRYEIVGFEVNSCSAQHNLNDMSKLHMYENIQRQHINCLWQVIQENETVAFTYTVEFVRSNITWPSRWDVYSDIDGVKFRNSILFPILLFFILQVVMHVNLRTIIRDRNRYEEVDNEAHLNEAVSGWRLLTGDVFREPGCTKLLCVMIGAGVQITMTFLVIIVLASLGFLSPASRGATQTSSIMLYLFFSIASGYTSVRLWRTVKGTSEGWKWISLSVACFFPGIVFVVLTFSNVVFLSAKSTRAVPISMFLILLSVWFCISVPLTFIGGFIGTTKLAKSVPYPTQTNHIPRQVPMRKFPIVLPFKSPSWLHVFVFGFVLFGILENKPSLTLGRVLSIWHGKFYSAFGDLILLLFMFVVFCAEASAVSTYTRLCLEDWRWWWKAFFTSGSVGIYVFLDSINDLVFKEGGLSGPITDVLYVGYSLIMAVVVMLATGAFGFLVSFYLVHYLYSSVKMSC